MKERPTTTTAAKLTSAELHELADEWETEGERLQREGMAMVRRARAARVTATILYRQEARAS